MTSNTKLNALQKQWTKDTKAMFNKCGGTIAQMGRFTVAKMPEFKGSKMARFSVSYCSPDEKKFRPKVGEHFVLRRMSSKEFITLPNMFTARDVAYMFYVYTGHFD